MPTRVVLTFRDFEALPGLTIHATTLWPEDIR